jgi:hypothetical protein
VFINSQRPPTDDPRVRLQAELLALGPQRVGVGIVDLARKQGRADLDQFAARREYRHPRAPVHLHLGQTEAGDQSYFGGTEHASRPEDPLAGRYVFTALDVLAFPPSKISA